MWLCLFTFKRLCWQISMSAWSLTILTHKVHQYQISVPMSTSSSSSESMSRRRPRQVWAPICCKDEQICLAPFMEFILRSFFVFVCKAGLLPMLRSVDEAPAHVWHVWSSLTRIGRWDPQALATPKHQATPHAYGMSVCSHTNTQNCSFLVISSLFCQAREPPGTLTRWFTSWSGAEHVWQQGP